MAQALELGFPKVIRLDGMPGGLDQDVAQFLAAFLGDMAGAMGLPAVMHARRRVNPNHRRGREYAVRVATLYH